MPGIFIRHKLIGPAIILLGSGLLFLRITVPFQQKIAMEREKISKAERKLQEQERMIKYAGIVKEHYQELWDASLGQGASQKQMTSVLSEIEDAAKSINIPVPKIMPSRGADPDAEERYHVQLTVEGEEDKILRFIYLLQSRPCLFSVEQMKMEILAGKSNVLLCRLELNRTFPQ